MPDIILTPDYHALFNRFLREAQERGESINRELECWEHYPTNRDKASALRTIQHLIAPIAIAAQSATTTDEIMQLRDTLAAILTRLDTDATNLEREPEEECTCTFAGDQSDPRGCSAHSERSARQ